MLLKIKFITFFILFLLFTSCSEDRLFDNNANDKLYWRVDINDTLLTRGRPISSPNDPDFKSFGIFGYYTKEEFSEEAYSSFLPNKKVFRFEDNSWNLDYTQYWPLTGKVSFFGYFPHVTGENKYGISIEDNQTGTPRLHYSMPLNVADQPDLMVAKTQKNLHKETVNLSYHHTLASIGFNINGNSSGIEYVGIKGISTSGTLSLDYSGGNPPSWSNISSVTDTLYKIGLLEEATKSSSIMSADGYLMVIPQHIGKESCLIVKFKDQQEKEIPLSTTSISEWKAGKVYIYQMKGGDYIFDVEVDESSLSYGGGEIKFTVTSQFQQSGGTSTNIGWDAEIIYEDSNHWLSGDISDSQGGENIDKVLTATAAPYTSTNEEDEQLKNAAFVSDKNLSLHNGKYTTANCYVVNAPGNYRFLCNVMGNTFNNSSSNTEPSNTECMKDGFLDYKGSSITSSDPKTLLIDTNNAIAEIVWQDSPDLITDLYINGIYIHFNVKKNTIAQGNAIIAIKNREGKIMWSWHIWVTPYIIGNDDFISGNGTIMKYNIGRCSGGKLNYLGRKALIKFTQKNTGKKETVTLMQNPISIDVEENSPYFVWGRKDPMLATNGILKTNSTNEYEDKDHYGNRKFEIKEIQRGISLSEAILNPNVFYACSNEYGTSRWNEEKNNMLWNYNKSIYDPSPVGYQVSPKYTLGDLIWNYKANKWLWPYALMTNENGKELKLYAMGARCGKTGSILNYKNAGYLWTMIPDSDDGRNKDEYIILCVKESETKGNVRIFLGNLENSDNNIVNNPSGNDEYRYKAPSYGLNIRPWKN